MPDPTQPRSSTLNYLLGDHLGLTSITADSAGARVAELMYKAWGENRYAFSTTPTTLRFTGQRHGRRRRLWSSI